MLAALPVGRRKACDIVKNYAELGFNSTHDAVIFDVAPRNYTFSLSDMTSESILAIVKELLNERQ